MLKVFAYISSTLLMNTEEQEILDGFRESCKEICQAKRNKDPFPTFDEMLKEIE